MTLLLGLPSKGRIFDDTSKWLEGIGLDLNRAVDSRVYRANLDGIAGIEVRLASAGEIASSLDAGTIHAGVTGLDIIHERAGGISAFVLPLKGLGFSRARVVVAVPDAWLDVENMSDLVDVAVKHFERARSRLRVATKFRELTRRFFAQKGIRDYRIVASQGATEGAPAAGVAEFVVDITETGATLAANQLRVLDDGLILDSQAVLAGSLAATWTAQTVETFRQFMRLTGMDEERANMFAVAAAGTIKL